jgi:hypothetical protein
VVKQPEMVMMGGIIGDVSGEHNSPANQAPPAEPGQTSKPIVLVVDDEPDIVDLALGRGRSAAAAA